MVSIVIRNTLAYAIVALSATSLCAQTTFTNTAAINPAAGPTSSSIVVSGLPNPISKVTVRLNNINGFTSDLDMLLVSPGGAKFKLLSDAGSSGTQVSNLTLTLDDDAASTVPNPAVSGTYRPTDVTSGAAETFPVAGPYLAPPVDTFATAFNGSIANGAWTLYVQDDVVGDNTNVAGGWSITITAAANQAPTATTLTSSVNPSFTTAPSNVTTLTATVVSGGNPVTVGDVTFSSGGNPLGTVALNGSGQAALPVSFATEGTRTVTASYNGTTSFAPSSGSISQQVDNRTVISGPQFCNPGTINVSTTGTSPYPQRVFVSGLGTTTTLNLTLNNITHATADDLDILLVSPDGRRYIPLSDAGGDFAANNVTLTLSDAASSSLPDATGLSSGTFRPTAHSPADSFPATAPAGPYFSAAPQGGETFTSVFGGGNPNGTWTLYAADDVLGNNGTIGGYCLTFTTSGDAPTSTTLSSSANPSITGTPVTITATVRRTSDNGLVNGGTVTFREGATVLAGPVGVVNGVATFTTSSLTEGTHVITADFSGVPGAANVSTGSFSQIVDDPTQVSGSQFCNLGAVVFPSGGTPAQYPLRINVSGLPGTIETLGVTFNGFSHTNPDDLDVLLVSPAGEKFVLLADAGGNVAVSGLQLVLVDTVGGSPAPQVPDNGPLSSGSYRPTAHLASGAFPSPAPGLPYEQAGPAGAATLTSIFGGTDPNGAWSLYFNDDLAGGSGSISTSVCLNFTFSLPDLTVSKSHSGNFSQGQTGATYTITVSNTGAGATSGTVTVSDTLPAGLTATAMSGSGWNCTVATLSCTRADALGASSSYPAITLTVDVAADAAAQIANTATVSGGGEQNTGNNTASDVTTVTQLISVTVGAAPGGLSFTVDGTTYTSPQTFAWVPGSNHTIATSTPQSGGSGIRHVFQSWSDGGAISHTVAPTAPTAFIASFQTQFELSTSVTPAGGGTVSPSGGFFDAGSQTQLTATPAACYTFSSWSANAPGGLVTFTSPQTVTATFSGSVTSNVNGQVSATFSGFRLNRATGRYLQTVTLVNNGGALSDVRLALDSLSGGVSLFGANGTTGCAAPAGSPYRTIGALGAGASTSVTLEFANPSAVPITYSRRVLAGAGQP